MDPRASWTRDDADAPRFSLRNPFSMSLAPPTAQENNVSSAEQQQPMPGPSYHLKRQGTSMPHRGDQLVSRRRPVPYDFQQRQRIYQRNSAVLPTTYPPSPTFSTWSRDSDATSSASASPAPGFQPVAWNSGSNLHYSNYSTPSSSQEERSGDAIGTSAAAQIDSKITYTDDASTKLCDIVRRKCSNCSTVDTSTWRRSALRPGKVVCNKCGLFERTHSRERPEEISLRRKALASSAPPGVYIEPHIVPPGTDRSQSHLLYMKDIVQGEDGTTPPPYTYKYKIPSVDDFQVPAEEATGGRLPAIKLA